MNHVIIYIRHGHDKPSSKHPSDERLSSKGKKTAKKMAKYLVKKYGAPDVIYTSPFHRTISTAKTMMKEAQATSLEIEPRIGRYFTSKERKSKSRRKICSSTAKKNPIINDDWKDFKSRVNEQMNEIIRDTKSSKDKRKVIWNISHSLVLLEVADHYKIKRDRHVEYLDTVVLKVKDSFPI